MPTKIRIVLLLLALGLSAMACGAETSKEIRTGGPHYFASFDGKFWPERPTRPITEKEAKSPPYDETYYVAHFDDKGRLLTLEKLLHGEPDWRSEYKYDKSGSAVEWVHTDGEGHRLAYDVNGEGRLRERRATK